MVCDVLSMLYVCINCNNVLHQCICTLSPCDCNRLCAHWRSIAGNKYPVLLLLFKYLGATLTENGDLDAEMAHTIQSEWKTLEERVLGVLCGRRISLRVKGKVVPIQDGCKTSNDVRCRDMRSEESTRRSWMWWK